MRSFSSSLAGAGRIRAYAEVLAMVGLSTLAGLLIAPRWGNAPVDLLYLPPVLASASLSGLRPGLFAAIVSALSYNFFFTPPFHTFRMDRPVDIVTVAILFLVALVTSQLASRMRTQARLADANARRNATIAGFARRLLSCSGGTEISRAACAELASLFGCNAVLMVPDGDGPAMIASVPENSPVTPSDIAAAALVLESGEPAGRGAPRLDPAEWIFYAVRSDRTVLAALGLARDDGRAVTVGDEQRLLLANLLDQVALALERANLEEEMKEVDQLRARDALRGALLSSVGHDLRTPLTAIIAAAAELRRAAPDAAFVVTIEGEAAKLERYISNLLDMARIEAGAIRIKAEPIDLVDCVAAALRDLRQGLSGHDVTVDLAPDVPLLRSDAELLHHCLINIVDNAARYSPPGGRIHILGRRDGEEILLAVEDEGPGLPVVGAELLERFATLSGSDRKGAAGLGLAIVKAFARAMGIGVEIANRTEARGAVVNLRFPPETIMPAGSEADVEQGA